VFIVVEQNAKEMSMNKKSDFKLPKGLKPGAELDYRFPESFEASIPEGVRVLTEFFAAMCRRDSERLAELMHFPYATYEGNECVVIDSADAFLSGPPPSLNVNALAPGSFALLSGIEVLLFDPVRVGLAMSFSRHRKDGTQLVECGGVYAVTKNNGKWALELSSTIFRPTDQLHVVYDDAVENALRLGREWMEGWTHSDGDLLDSTRQFGLHAGIGYPGPGNRFKAVQEGNLARVYRSTGITSRLNITETKPDSKGRYDFPAFRINAGHGIGGYAYSLHRPDSRVLHQTYNKAHIAAGYTRYQADGSLLSETHGLSIITQVNNHWGMAGGFGAVIRHDATNDERG
jgi:hypothetical protein